MRNPFGRRIHKRIAYHSIWLAYAIITALAAIHLHVNQWSSAIAERLVLSPKTVRNYITEIFSKLQVADRAQAIIRARNAGLT